MDAGAVSSAGSNLQAQVVLQGRQRDQEEKVVSKIMESISGTEPGKGAKLNVFA